jgi:hypothetical protein
MEKTHDYIRPTARGGRCRMRIYQDGDELPVVVCTELPDNEGMSITNAAGQIAASPGPSPFSYSSECVEVEFSEVRRQISLTPSELLKGNHNILWRCIKTRQSE